MNNGSIDGDSAAAYRYCVVGDTLVNTDNGLIPIEEIAKTELNSDNDIDIEVESFDGKKNKAIKLFNSGNHKTIKVTTELGYSITGTYNHPIMVMDKDIVDWKLLENISLNNYVAINIKETQISSNDNTDYSLDKYDYKKLVKVPECILNKSLNIQKQFLQYLFKNNENHSLNFSFKEKLAKQVQIMLLQFGILSSIENNNGLEIIDYSKFEKNICSLNIRNNKLLKNNHGLKLKEYNGFVFLPIKFIEDTGVQTVYSVKVDSNCHSFTANGFINHNTEGRLEKISNTLLDGIDEKAVPFKPNYSEHLLEPEVLPGIFPQLLLNGR